MLHCPRAPLKTQAWSRRVNTAAALQVALDTAVDSGRAGLPLCRRPSPFDIRYSLPVASVARFTFY